MKTIEERAKAFCENNICVDCEDRKNCDKGCLGCSISTYSALEWLIQFGKSEHEELMRWHDPKEIVPNHKWAVLVKLTPSIYDVASYSTEMERWIFVNYSLDREEIIGWREIHE